MKRLSLLLAVVALLFAVPVSAGIKVCQDGYVVVHRHVRGGDDPLDLARTPQLGWGEQWPGFATYHYCQNEVDGSLYPLGDHGDAEVYEPDPDAVEEAEKAEVIFYAPPGSRCFPLAGSHELGPCLGDGGLCFY